MAFRDDELATRSRVDVLQAELQGLRAENDELKRNASAAEKTYNPWFWAVPVLGVIFAVLASFREATDGNATAALVLTVAATLALTATAITAVLSSLWVVVPPGHIAVFSGRSNAAPDEQKPGFRVVSSGRALRVPLIERVDMLRVGAFRVESTLSHVHTKGGKRTNVQIRAEISLAKSGPLVVNAVERFLGRDEQEIATVGRETLEGAARIAAAHLTAHELREDRMRVSEVMKDARADFDQLGLRLESFHILDVTEV